jgi:hypothetical protein
LGCQPTHHPRQQPALCKRRQYSDAQALRRPARRGRCRLHAIVELRQRSLHAAQQHRARGIEHDAASPPLEDLEAELFFEHANLLADRAMRDMQHVSRGAQVQQFGDGRKPAAYIEGRRDILVSVTYRNVKNKSIYRGSLGSYPYQRQQPDWSKS